ncbi:Protein RRP5 [Nowakowskiella sp. JEL0407]|nr:Protein RRP5 [Nowakowskiella sp. JEL0407]
MDFPRGGESTLSDLDKRRIRSLADNDALFNADDSSQDVSLSKKKKRKLPNNATSESSTTPKSTSSASSSPNFLSIKKISPGSNSLALISKISALQIDLLLQDSQKATLSIADVNSYFSDIAAAYLESESSNESDLPSLSDYFHVEQFLSVKVIEVTNKGVNVSISPEILNKDVNVSQLTPGTFIHGYVKSVQDKGYEVDLGLKNISGFLPFASSSQSEPSEKLKLGTQVCGRVEKKSDRVLRLQFATSMELSKSLDYEITRAGALYDAKLVSVTESEVILDYSGVKIHVNNFGVTKQRKDELGLLLSGESAAKKSKSGAAPSFDKKKQQTTLVRITHIDSEKKFVYGSLLDHIVNQNGIPKPDPNIKIGDTLKTRILRHDAGFGLVSAHPENSNILVYVFNSSISDTKPFTYPKVDSLQKTRILSFNPFSNIYFGSMQPSVLSKPFISSSQLEPGLTVRAKIVKFDKIGLFVTFSGFKGLCPIAHLTDTGGNSELTISKLEKVYKVGNEEKFRIWESDPENDRLILTKKKGLMDSELIGYDAEFRGVVTDGVISAVQELGLVVQFFGGVRGFCPKQEMGTAFSEKTYKDDFKSGQLIKCRIVTTDPVNKKLRLSLKLSSPAPSVAKSDAVKVGQIVKGKIVSTHETSFQVQIIPQNITAKLFLDHLTDHPSHIEKIKKDLTESTSNTPKLSNGTSKKSKNEQDEVIELVVYLNNEKRGLVVSMKPALINFVKRNSRHWETNSGENQKGKKSKKSGLMEEFAEYQPKIEVGSKLPSVIKNVKEDSILVEFIGGQTALARKSNISDTFITPDIVMGSFKVGQTVYSTILEISEDDETTNENGIPRKVFVSLKESINFKLEEPELEFEYLQSMLAERKLKGAAVNKLHDKFKIGSVVKGEKGKILPYGMLVTFEDNVSGLVTVAHMEEQDEKSATKKPKSKEKDEATTVTAKVFDIDEEKKVLDLTLKKDIVGNTVSEETKAKLLKAYQAKTSVDMVIQLLKQDYIIGILPQFNNCIVFATSRTYNSVSDTAFLKYKVGKRVTGVLASIGDNTDGRIILVPSRKDVNVKPAKKDKSGGQGTVEVNIGDDVKVVVNSVKPLQVNVKIGQYIGRIYCTEVSDSWEFFKNAEFLHQDGNDTAVTLKARRRPLAKIFKSGQEVECRVLGMNDLKTHNYLPITKRVGGNVLELSLKRKGEEEAPEIKVGDERVGFVTKVTDAYVFVNLTPKLMGRVNLLSTVNTLSKLRRSFKSWFAVGTPVNCKVENMTEKFTDLTILDIISNTEYTPKFKNTVGDRVLCKVVKVDDLGVIVELPAKSFGRCFVTDVDDVYSDGWKKKMVIGSLRECILLSEDDGKWKVSFRESRIDTAASDDDDKSVADEDGEMAEVSKNVIELSDSEEEEEDENNNQSDADNDDKETEEEKTDVESATSKISPISPNYKAHLQECREINSTEEVEENEVLQGFIKNISDKGFFVSLGRDVVARVKISELSDDFVKDWKSLGRVGMLVRGRVIRLLLL